MHSLLCSLKWLVGLVISLQKEKGRQLSLMGHGANAGEEAEKELGHNRRNFRGTREDQAVSRSSGAPVLAATLPRSKGLPTRTCYLTCLFLFFTILKITFLICEFLTLDVCGFIRKAFQLFLLFFGVGTFAVEKHRIHLKALASLKS